MRIIATLHGGVCAVGRVLTLRRAPTRSRLVLGALSCLVLAAAAPPARALPPNTPDPGADVPDYFADDVVHNGSTTYVGGYFSWWGPFTGAGAELSVPGGAQTGGFPTVAGGAIDAAVGDGEGGVYIGGSFTSVGGQPDRFLAHIEANGTVDPEFAPNPSAEVTTLAYAPGGPIFTAGTLYVGGKFTTLDGVARSYLGALTISLIGSFSLSDRFAPCLSSLQNDDSGHQPYPYALAVTSTTVYVGGDFDDVTNGLANSTTHQPTCTGGGVFSDVAAFNRSTGAASAPVSAPPGDGTVYALALSPDDGTLYMGGDFPYTGSGGAGTERELAAANLSSGATDTGWQPKAAGTVYALLASGATVYVGGDFATIGSNAASRAGLAQLNGVTGLASATGFDAGLTASADGNEAQVHSLATDDPEAPTRLFAGGQFTAPSGADQLATLDPGTGAAAAGFTPDPGDSVDALAATGTGTVYAGGDFQSLGASFHQGIAALDGYGHVLPITFRAAYATRTLVVSPDGSQLFSPGIGAWSTATGQPLAWTPPTGAFAVAFSPDSTTVYVGGSFSQVDGQPRDNLAAFSAITGALLPWAPNPDGVVESLAVSPDGGTVYVGGKFAHIGVSVATRQDLAAVSASTGEATAWDPEPNNQVDTLAVSADGNHVYAGGAFNGPIGASPQGRDALAELTADTANPTPFAESYSPNGIVTSVAPVDSGAVVYVGGAFGSIGGTSGSQHAEGIAALDGGSGKALPWTPETGGDAVSGSIAADGDTAWLTDDYDHASDGREYYAQFSTAPVSLSSPTLNGAPEVGAAVLCRSGGWANAPATLSVTWALDGTPIAGATGASLTPTSGQAGHWLSCTETAVNPGGSARATSAAQTIAALPTTTSSTSISTTTTSTTTTPPATPSLTLRIRMRATRFAARRGTRLTATVSAAATVSLKITRSVRGHRHGHRCSAAKPRRLTHPPRCTITERVAATSWLLHAGATTLTLLAIHRHRLPVGHLLATFTAAAGLTRSRPVRVELTVTAH